MIKDIIQNVYSKHPLVHNITNYVAATDCANITLTPVRHRLWLMSLRKSVK